MRLDREGPRARSRILFRILTKQGTDAPSEAREYLVKGHRLSSLAVMTYPAGYGVSGAMSFIVNQDGLLDEKDFGKKTQAIASTMTMFNPEKSWKPIAPPASTADLQQ